MPNQQRKEPWKTKIYSQEGRNDSGKREERNGKKHKKGQTSTVFLTFLVVIMFVIIGAALVFTFFNSRKPNMNSVEKQFYPKASKTAVANNSASSKESVDNSEASDRSISSDTSSSSSSGTENSDNTYTIVAGDYPSLIASKTGVSWNDIVKLNPGLDPNSPGYYTNGSQLTVGQTLKIKK